MVEQPSKPHRASAQPKPASRRVETAIPAATRLALLRLLAGDPALSQRAIAQQLGISVGKAHYCLQALVDRGLVKAGNFARNPRKRGYLYLLTPGGVQEKATLTMRFLRRKEAEHAALVAEIEQLRREAAGLADRELVDPEHVAPDAPPTTPTA